VRAVYWLAKEESTMGLVIAGPQNRRWSQGGRRWAVVAVLLMCGASLGQPAFLNLDEHAGPEPRSDTRSFPFVVHPSQTKLYFDVKVTLSAGQLTLRILDANGTVLREDRTDGSLSVQGSVPAETHGTFQLEAVTEDAVGEWKAQVCPLSRRRPSGST
jgi:hypothetical protein